MALLNGTIDRVIDAERKNLQKYLKGTSRIDIELNGDDLRILKEVEEL